MNKPEVDLDNLSDEQLYAHGLDLLEWIINCHLGDKRQLQRHLRLAIYAIRAQIFKRKFPEFDYFWKDLGSPKP